MCKVKYTLMAMAGWFPRRQKIYTKNGLRIRNSSYPAERLRRRTNLISWSTVFSPIDDDAAFHGWYVETIVSKLSDHSYSVILVAFFSISTRRVGKLYLGFVYIGMWHKEFYRLSSLCPSRCRPYWWEREVDDDMALTQNRTHFIMAVLPASPSKATVVAAALSKRIFSYSDRTPGD